MADNGSGKKVMEVGVAVALIVAALLVMLVTGVVVFSRS
jgi:hypothetical protein